jgi:hypothetical protein
MRRQQFEKTLKNVFLDACDKSCLFSGGNKNFWEKKSILFRKYSRISVLPSSN